MSERSASGIVVGTSVNRKCVMLRRISSASAGSSAKLISSTGSMIIVASILVCLGFSGPIWLFGSLGLSDSVGAVFLDASLPLSLRNGGKANFFQTGLAMAIA